MGGDEEKWREKELRRCWLANLAVDLTEAVVKRVRGIC